MTINLEETMKSGHEKPHREIADRVKTVSQKQFVEQFILPILHENKQSIAGPQYTVSTVENQNGSTTIEYEFAGVGNIQGTLFSDDSGLHRYNLLRQLWNGGFDGKQAYRVQEPLGFVNEQNLLLSRSPIGTKLTSLLTSEPDEAARAVRQAARWLSKLHKSSLDVGRADEIWDAYRTLSVVSSHAAAKHPEESKTLKIMTTSLERLAPTHGAETVLVHGNFQPANIFMDGDSVTTASLDWATRSDPAKDLAEFIHSLRSTLHALGKGNHADPLTKAFLEEYWRQSPSGLDNLPFYLSLQIFASTCVRMMDLQPASVELEQTLDHNVDEFELAASNEFAPQQGFSASGRVRERYRLSHEKRAEGKKLARSKVSIVTTKDFVTGTLYPLAYPGSRTNGQDCRAKVIRDIGTGRVTIRYLFGDGTTVYGKLYSDPLVAQHGYRVQMKLWEEGFDSDGSYRVPEPLAYFPEHGLVLQKSAGGRQLEEFIEGDSDQLVANARNAAKWLVRFHGSSFRMGPPESLWQSAKLFKAIRKLDKACGFVPSERSRLLSLVDQICQVGAGMKHDVPLVQTHGRFHHDHIFVEGENVSVIDFDGSVPSDPAKDLAELLRLLRSHTFARTGSTAKAELPERAFLDEYLSQMPENGANLGPIWGITTMVSIFKKVKKFGKKKIGRDEFEATMEFYLRELETILSRSWAQSS